jgi:hypothetical protein
MAGRKLKEPWIVAALIAELMKRSGQSRARLSDVTLKKLAGRVKLETSIREQIRLDCLDYGYLLHKLDGKGSTSGTAVIAISALHAAKPIKATSFFDDTEKKAISDGTFDFVRLHEELLGESDDDENE